MEAPDAASAPLLPTRSSPLRLGWFSSGRGEGSRGLLTAALDAIDSGRLNAVFEFVFINRDRGQAAGSDAFMDIVEGRGIPLVALSSQRFRREHGRRPWRELREPFDEAVMDLLQPYSPDVSAAAGYMLIAPALCRHYRMLNLHPALPGGPIGMWQGVIWDLIRDRAEETGVMINVVTEDVDGGPVVSYCRFSFEGDRFAAGWHGVAARTVEEMKEAEGEDLPLFREIREAGLERERPLLVETLAAVAEGRIDIDSARTEQALDLTAEIERLVAGRCP